TQLVQKSFDSIRIIQKKVNDMLQQVSNTHFLSMSYEEFLYPVVFTAKKKYYGIPHEKIINFKPKELFIRGLEVKKRGVSEILRKIYTEIMWTSMNLENIYELIELVHHKIDDIYVRKWDPTDFIATAVFRPNKKNVRVNTFVRRMKET